MGSRDQGYDTLVLVAGDKLLTPREHYHNNRTLLTFECNSCPSIFHTTKFLYEKSVDGKRCPSCRRQHKVVGGGDREEYIRRCVINNGEYYSYELVPEQFNQKDKITIICPEHGEFSAEAHAHKVGKSGCPRCKVEKVTSVTRSNITEFVIKANVIHSYKYNYTKSLYVNAKSPIVIGCPQHGPFSQTPDTHLRGSGCPKCTSVMPVREICAALSKLGLTYITEKTFDACVSVRKLRFDVYVPELNLCIEYDGPHHTLPMLYGGRTQDEANEALTKQQEHDTIKNEFCEKNHIDLIRIPYTEYNPGAIVTSYVQSKTPERYIYTYINLADDVKRIASYIRSFNYDRFAIYGIKRGGLLFSLPLTYTFEEECEYGIVTYQRYDGNDRRVTFDQLHTTTDIPIFVIDDLISSGITMKKVTVALQHKFKKATIHPIVIFGDENDDGVFFIHPHPKQWIVFPYENS